LEQFQPPGDAGVPEDPEGDALSTPLRERPDAPLGTLIFRAGLLPAETIENALEEGVKTGKRLGEILTERGLIQEADLARLLAGQKGLSFVTLREQIVDPAAAGLFSEDQARLFRALPYAFEEGVPVVAIADPTDEVLTRNVREALARDDARFVVSIRSELANIIGEVYAEGVAPAPAPAPAPQHEAPSFPDVPGSDPGQSASDGAGLGEAPAPQPPSPAEPPAPEPVAEAPVPAEPALSDTTGSDPESGPEGQAQAPVELAVNGHHENRLLAPEVVPAPQPEIVHAQQPEPVAAPAPEPVAAPAPEPVAAPAPAPEPIVAPVPEHAAVERVVAEPVTVEPVVAETNVQPVVAPVAPPPAEPAAPQPAPAAPERTPAAAPAREPQLQPAPVAGVAHRLSVRLTNGERVEMGAFDDLEAAKAAAKALMAQVAAADGGDWPFVSGRFLKPDTIVSVDIS
jgi:hypothetical protein